MKHLLLLRHAEAEAAPDGTDDIERALTVKGRLEAAQAAGCIARIGLQINAILVSSARRTRETARIVLTQLSPSVAPVHQMALYLATANTLLRSVHECTAEAQTLLLVAHNPGISELAQQLSGGSDAICLRTSGLCHLTFMQTTWSDLSSATAVEHLR